MTDDNASSPSRHSTPTPPEHQTKDSVELDYPQLLLEASLHSLLTHSQSSAASTVINMPRSTAAMSESWASLSDTDISQDDDLRSETTDVGSLIDGSSVQDVHSVNESGESSEAEESEDADISGDESIAPVVKQDSVHSTQSLRHRTNVEGASQVDTAPPNTYQGSSTYFTQDSMHTSQVSSSGRLTSIPDQIAVPRATSALELHDLPFRVLCMSTTSTSRESRSAILGKIGAALVVDSYSRRDPYNYHVIPSQFGPGFKPEFSELIPVTKQLALHESTFPDSCVSTTSRDRCIYKLPDGSSLVFSTVDGVKIVNPENMGHQPKMLLCLVSEHDSRKERGVVEHILSLARSCLLGVMVVEESCGRSRNPAPLTMGQSTIHKYVSDLDLNDEAGIRLPVNVDEFLTFESDHLNKHLQFLHECSTGETVAPSTAKRVTPGKFDIPVWLTSQNEGIEDGQPETAQPSSKDVSRCNHKQDYGRKQLVWLWSAIKPFGHVIIAVLLSSLVYVFTTSFFRSSTLGVGSVHSSGPQFTGSLSSSWASSTMTSSTATATSAAAKRTPHADLSLFSGMLHDVAEYWPAPKPFSTTGAEANGYQKPQQPIKKHEIHVCDKINEVSTSQRGAMTIVPDEFYHDGKPAFAVSVARGRRHVPFHITDLGYERHAIRVDSNELRGLLKVSISVPGDSRQVLCIHVNLSDTPIEGLASIVGRGKGGNGDPKHAPTDWTLIRLRKASSGRLSGFRDITRYAMKTIDAAHAAVEDTAVSQVVACYHAADECWLRKAQKYEKQLSGLAQKYETKVITSAARVCGRAKVLANGAAQQASKALDLIRKTVTDVSEVPLRVQATKREMSKHLSKKASRAQRRARKIVHDRMRR